MKKLLLVVGLAVCMVGIAKAELFTNPGFEDDLTDWSNWGSGSNRTGASTSVAVMEDGTAHSGDKYAENSWDLNAVPAPTSGFNLLFQNPLIVPGDTYTLSAWLRDGLADPQNPGAGTIPARLTFEQRWWDGVSSDRGDEVDVNGDGQTSDDRVHFDFDVPSDGQWHLISATHTAPLTVNQFTAIVVIMQAGSILDMDDVSIMPNNAHNPNPADGSDVAITLDALGWENPVPNDPEQPITCEVYFTSDYPEAGMYEGDPNFTDYAESIPVNEDNISASVPEALVFGTTYHWRVDCTDPNTEETVIGHVWEFTVSNTGPAVDAGDDVHVWLTDGSVVVNLAATVTDDGHPSPPAAYTLGWAVTSGAVGTILITNPAVEDAQVIINALGAYTLELTADDSELSGSDSVVINVYETACDATKGAGIVLPATDVNQDCAINMGDVLEIAANWLECMSYDCL